MDSADWEAVASKKSLRELTVSSGFTNCWVRPSDLDQIVAAVGKLPKLESVDLGVVPVGWIARLRAIAIAPRRCDLNGMIEDPTLC